MFDALSNIYRHESRSLSKTAEGPQQNGSSVQEKKSESLLVQAWHSSNMAAPFPFWFAVIKPDQNRDITNA